MTSGAPANDKEPRKANKRGAARLAAEHPERIDALVMYASVASSTWAPDYYWAMTREQRDELAERALARRGEPKSPVDLHRHACINWRFPGSGAIYRWQFEKKGKKVEMAVEGPLISNHQDVVVEAALQGLGILYAYDDDRVEEAVLRGRLKHTLVDWSLKSPGLYLYYSNRRHPQPALRAFIDCLLDRDEAASKRRTRT